MRVGLFKTVHVKTLMAQEQRMLLTSRKLLQRKLLDIESDMRGTLRNFGLNVGAVSTRNYEARIRELVAGFPRLAVIVEPLLTVRAVMRQQLATLHKMLLSNCICQVAGAIHFRRLLHSAFAMVTSFLATAVIMTLCGLPALRRRSAKDFRLGL